MRKTLKPAGISLPTLCLALALCASIAGCAATATVRVLQPIENDLQRYRRAFVVVTAPPEVRYHPQFEYAQSRLRAAMVERLRVSGMFEQVLDEPPADPTDSDLKVVATIASLGREATPPAVVPGARVGVGIGRGWGGFGAIFGLGTILPGPSIGLITQVEVLTAATERRVAHVDAHARRGDLDAQADAIADKVVAEIFATGR